MFMNPQPSAALRRHKKSAIMAFLQSLVIACIVLISIISESANANIVISDARISDITPLIVGEYCVMRTQYQSDRSYTNLRFADLAALDDTDKKSFCARETLSPSAKGVLDGKIIEMRLAAQYCEWRGITQMQSKGHYAAALARNLGAIPMFHAESSRDKYPDTGAQLYGENYHPFSDFPYVVCGFAAKPGVAASPSQNMNIYDLTFDAKTRAGYNKNQDIAIVDLRVDIVIDKNPFTDVMPTGWYNFIYNGLCPVLYMATAVLYAYTLYRWTTKMKWGDIPMTVRVTLITECVSLSILSLHLFICSWHSRYMGDAGTFFTFMFTTQLNGLSLVTTILTAIFWHKLRLNIKTLKRNSSNDVKWWVIVLMFIICFGLDFAIGICIALDIHNFELVGASVLFAGQLAVAIYFFVQVVWAQMHLRKILGISKHNSGILARLLNVAWWLLANGIIIMLTIIHMAIAMMSSLAFTPIGWPIVWALYMVLRAANGFTQVMAIQPPKDKSAEAATRATSSEDKKKKRMSRGSSGGKKTSKNSETNSNGSETGTDKNTSKQKKKLEHASSIDSGLSIDTTTTSPSLAATPSNLSLLTSSSVVGAIDVVDDNDNKSKAIKRTLSVGFDELGGVEMSEDVEHTAADNLDDGYDNPVNVPTTPEDRV